MGPSQVGEPPLGTHPPEVLVDGAILRDALLPVWIARALAGLLALVAVLALLWFTLVKPQINAAAQNQVKKQITPVSMALNSVASTVASLATSPTSITWFGLRRAKLNYEPEQRDVKSRRDGDVTLRKRAAAAARP